MRSAMLSPRVEAEDSRGWALFSGSCIAIHGTDSLGSHPAFVSVCPRAIFIILGSSCLICIMGVTWFDCQCSPEADMEGAGDKGEAGCRKLKPGT